MLDEDFYIKNKDSYPPFIKGLYIEEYFLQEYNKNKPSTKRKYIPVLWTNFQIHSSFHKKKNTMQIKLNNWVKNNPSPEGYFTIVQYDDGCLLKLPENTIVYGCCSGDIPIPLIYQDINNKLCKIPKKSFGLKKILCSFVGTHTKNNVLPDVRGAMIKKFSNNKDYIISLTNGWTPSVDKNKQNNFISITIDSKFAFAPRGYGRSSFRFFEIFQLGTIPIYLWNDKNWLPFKDVIDYEKICISLNIKDIDKLDNIIKNIDEEKYNEMWLEYEKIKHYFTLEGFYQKIINDNN